MTALAQGRGEGRAENSAWQVLATSDFCGPERQGSCGYHQCWRLHRTGFEEEPPGEQGACIRSDRPAARPPAASLLRRPSLLHTESKRTFGLLCTVLVLLFAKRMFLNRPLPFMAVILGSPPEPERTPPPGLAIWPPDCKARCLRNSHLRNEFGYECCRQDGKGLKMPQQRRFLNGLHREPSREGPVPACFSVSTAHLALQSPATRGRHKGGCEAGGGEEISDCHLGKMWTHYLRPLHQPPALASPQAWRRGWGWHPLGPSDQRGGGMLIL